MGNGSVAKAQVDDVALALRMMDGDEGALSLLISRCGPRVMHALMGRYGNQVSGDVLEDAIHRAAFALWQKADRFDDSRGSLGGLFYKCACHEVANIMREGKNAQHISLEELDRAVSLGKAPYLGEDHEELSAEKRRLYLELHEVIQGLPGHQRAIAEADLVAGCDANNAELARSLGTSKNSIYVSRNKGREKISQEMKKRGHFE